MNLLSVLLIDDNESQLEVLAGFIQKLGFRVATANSGESGTCYLQNNYIDLVITDFKMPGINGIQVLEQVKAINPDIEVMLITAFGTIEDSVEAMKKGAWDYLSKPIDLEELKIKLHKLANYKNLQKENAILQARIDNKFPTTKMVYKSRAMDEVMNLVARVCDSNVSVLITGESGTGKEMIARAIHHSSLRANHPFIPVNCAAIPESLFESEFFGHEKGAFTGSIKRRLGHFEVSDKGTLFLDEVADIPLNFQVKLLRAIQEKEFQRLGSSQFIQIDTRIISATNQNIEKLVKQGRFRSDLFFRLNVIPVVIPPLRDRKEDIHLLAEYFIEKYRKINNRSIESISKEALDKLTKYHFPGNVRELENLIERAVILSRNTHIQKEDIAISDSDLPVFSTSTRLEERVEELEKQLIQKTLKKTGGNKTAAAKILGISERVIRYKIKKYNI
ncbi:MAG: sigma-54-dependent Fis family transcriptional regulator [Candidatus Marinimicrobia bacterium]|nr:sigma-54-dependent Fis family transcriptional regulator [Candidatus Neomarinimicrobiota bacterium]